jgi:hypothetical protein
LPLLVCKTWFFVWGQWTMCAESEAHLLRILCLWLCICCSYCLSCQLYANRYAVIHSVPLNMEPTTTACYIAVGNELVTMRNGHRILAGRFWVIWDTLYLFTGDTRT